MVELRSALEINTNSSPEEAAQNIDRSKLFDVTPDSYKELKDTFNPKADAMERIPASLPPVTQEVATQSKEHLALTSSGDGLDKMSGAEKRLKYYKNKIIDIPELRRERNELSRKKLQTDTGVLDPAEEEHLQGLNSNLNQMQQEKFDTDPGGFEDFAVDVASGLGDIVRSYWDNKGLIAASVGTGGLVGAGIGAATPIPGGTLLGAAAGAGKGLAVSAIAVPFVDAYVQSRDSIYNDLRYAIDEKTNQPMNLSHDRSKYVAQGAALISGAAAAAAGKVFASNNPFLRKFTNSSSAAKYMIQNPSVMAKFDVIGGILKSGAAEGGEEVVQSLTETVATELGKMDGSEASFLNALDNIGGSLKELPYTFAVGAGAGGAFASATNLPMHNQLKDTYARMQDVSRQKSEVLETQNVLIQVNEDLKSTKLQELAPEEARSFKQKLFSSLGMDENAWFSVEDLKKFASSPEKGKKIRSIIDINPEITKLSQETNSPIKLSKAEVLDVMTDFPELSDYMRLTPEGQNPFEIRNEAKTFVDNLNMADKLRASFLETIGVTEDVELTAKEKADALQPLNDSPYFANETDYQTNRSMVQEHEGIVSADEANAFNDKYQKAKNEVASILNEDANDSFNSRENRLVKVVDEETIKQELVSLDKELTILESFKDKANMSEASLAIKQRHKGKGFSPSAIDPETLPKDLKEYYLENETLKKRKVFVKGGISLEEAAALNGVDSGQALLKILANTPTKEQIIKNRQEAKTTARKGVQDYLSPERAKKRDEAFSNMTKIHREEMEFMKSKAWSTIKRGIIKIGTYLPSVEEINTRATNTIKGMRIRDLNVKQFRNGEIKSQRLAMKQFVNAEYEQAFENKGKAAYNSELQKETLKAQDRVKRNLKFWQRANSESNIQELKDAGVFEVMNEFTSLYKLDGKIKGEQSQKNLVNFIKSQVALGNPVPSIPDQLNNTQASYQDLTVDQYDAMTNFGEFILKQARDKNKLLREDATRKEFETHEFISSEIDRLLKDDPDYNEKRSKTEENPTDSFEEVKSKLKSISSSFNNAKNLALRLDQDKLGGFFYKTLVQPLIDSNIGKKQDLSSLKDHMKKTIKEFYGSEKNYQKVLTTRLNIPEFANIDTLNNGLLRKIDLMKMMAYVGDPDGRSRIENFKNKDGSNLDFETVMKVLDREIDENDAGFVQNYFYTPFKMFEKSVADLHKRTKGFDLDMKKGVPFTHRGKVYEGGYQPLNYQRLPDDVRLQKELEQMQKQGLLEDDDGYFAEKKRAESTYQGRTKDRIGSQRPLDLRFENHFTDLEDIIHDVHFRETGIDLLKILKGQSNISNIKAVIGSNNFNVLTDSINDVISKNSEKESPLFVQQRWGLNNLLQGAKSLEAIRTIGFNLMSSAIQVDSLIYAPLRLGAKSSVYLSKTVAKLSSNLYRYDEMVSLAAKYNPDINTDQADIDEEIYKTTADMLPQSDVFLKKYQSVGTALSRLGNLRKWTVEKSFVLLKKADQGNKVILTLSTVDQFLNGDVDGFSLDKVNKMSDSEKAQTIQKLVKQATDVTLTAGGRLDKTALEKHKAVQLLVNYWTDRRSRLMSIVAKTNQGRRSFKKGEYKQAAQHLMTLAFFSGLSTAFQSALRDEEESVVNRVQDISSADDAMSFVNDTFWDFATAPATQLAESIPGVDSAIFAYKVAQGSRGNQLRPVSVPITAFLTNIVAGGMALNELMEDGLDFENLKRKDRKALVNLAGYGALGAPTNAVNNLIDILQNENGFDIVETLTDDIKRFNKNASEFVDKFKDKPEAETLVNDIKEVQKSLPQFDQNVDTLIPENTKEDLKQVISKGDWKTYNQETGEAGIYGYTKAQWDELTVMHPDLGLTENGRLAKDGKQQEKAMDREMQENVKLMMTYEVPVTKENILGAHKFGVDNFVNIANAHDDEKLSDILGEEAKNPMFKNFSNVKSIKQYLSREINKTKQ